MGIENLDQFVTLECLFGDLGDIPHTFLDTGTDFPESPTGKFQDQKGNRKYGNEYDRQFPTQIEQQGQQKYRFQNIPDQNPKGIRTRSRNLLHIVGQPGDQSATRMLVVKSGGCINQLLEHLLPQILNDLP